MTKSKTVTRWRARGRVTSFGSRMNSAARWAAEEAVKARLKVPATAQFSNASIREISECVVRVRTDVDAHNSFGALIRTSFGVDLEYNQGTQRWLVKYVGEVPST